MVGQANTRSVGRYGLLLELGKSPLGSLWLGKANAEAGPELLILRRIQLTRALSASDRDLLADAARWSLGATGDSIVKNVEVVVEPSELVIASEQHAGETLRSLLRLSNFKRQAIPSSIATRICLDICRGLESALEHAALSPRGPNFVSGGLLPDSVLVSTDGRTRLLDVGVAATWCGMTSVAEHPEVTAYRAPEALNEGASPERDPRSDIFTLGTLLWEMLSGGRRLFLGSSHGGVVQRVLTHPIPPVSGGATRDPAPESLIELMQRALERDPRRRFPTLSSLTQALLGQSPAEPEAVQEYVNRVAKSALDSRRRVVERALKKAQIQPAPAQPRKLAASTSAVRAPTAPAARSEPRPATAPTEHRAASASVRPPLLARDAGFAPPPLAKPLPLPAQAKLGVAVAGAPPPPPPPASSPENEAPREVDPSSSVRAADIMRALAVEDAPESEPAATVRNPHPTEQPATLRNPSAGEHARAVERALSETPPPPAGADSTAPNEPTGGSDASSQPQPAATVPGMWQPRPRQDTNVGLGPDLAPSLQATPEAASVASTPGAQPPHSAGEDAPESAPEPVIAPLPSDRLTTARPLAAHIGDTPKIPKPAALPRIDAPGKARSKRIPVSVLVGGAAAVLLLVFGLIFALADDPDEAQTKAAVPEPAPPDPRHVEASASPAPAQEPAGEQRPHGAGDEPKAGEEPEPSDAEPAEPAADSEEPAEAPAPPAKAVAQPRAVAPKPRANRRPVQRKRKAKRNFIPSGI